ncbi:MAG: methyltransferase, partial [Paludibacteraceae bacterium]|nr:methyltransferase [Paludibacteraceae bacterium]
DIGTGSGCIAIALKKQHPEWDVTGIDISAQAIEVARENAKRNGVEVNLKVRDIFADCAGLNEENTHYDIVVSNPPYICEREKSGMRRNVLEYEPASALFVPDHDPLLFYRRIASLHWGTQLFFEINEGFAKETEDVLREQGYTDIRTVKDIYGKERIVAGRLINRSS